MLFVKQPEYRRVWRCCVCSISIQNIIYSLTSTTSNWITLTVVLVHCDLFIYWKIDERINRKKSIEEKFMNIGNIRRYIHQKTRFTFAFIIFLWPQHFAVGCEIKLGPLPITHCFTVNSLPGMFTCLFAKLPADYVEFCVLKIFRQNFLGRFLHMHVCKTNISSTHWSTQFYFGVDE